MKKFFLIGPFLALAAGTSLIYYFYFDLKPIPEEKFIDIYIDYLTAQDSLGTDIKSSEKIRNNLFSKYKITNEQYNFTLSYYNESPERWGIFFDKVIKKIEAMRDIKAN